MKAAFYTLGCKVNQYDTQTMMELFEKAGYEIVDFEQRADIYIINTCTVTAMSDRKSRQMISRAHALNKDASIAVCGCYAQRDAEAILKLPNVRLALGNKNRGQIVRLMEEAIHDGTKINAVESINDQKEFEELSAHSSERTRAHLKIQDGCNRFCSYCIIPYARGPIRSRQLDDIIKEVKRLCQMGYKEFVLTGIHLASYSVEQGGLECVLKALYEIAGVERIRLGSLEPSALTDEFLELCASNEKLCRQFHVSMQSGCDSILKRMNRKYSAEEYAHYIERTRDFMPDAAITTDIIAGFPGETDDEHNTTAQFIRKIKFARIHVFPFSMREGTAAAKMSGQIDSQIKNKRAQELIEIGKKMEHEYIESQIGKIQKVLLEHGENGMMTGHTPTYIQTTINTQAKSGDIIEARLILRKGEGALGESL